MKTWVKDNRITEEFKEELDRKGIIDVDGYRYVADDVFGRFVVRRISFEKMKEINGNGGKVTMFDFDYVAHENSNVFKDGNMHKA